MLSIYRDKAPTQHRVNKLVGLLVSAAEADDEGRAVVAEALKHVARTAVGRQLIANTGQLQLIAYVLIDPDVCDEVAGLVLNLTYPSDVDSTVRGTLVDGGVVRNLTAMLEFGCPIGKRAALGALQNLTIGCQSRGSCAHGAGCRTFKVSRSMKRIALPSPEAPCCTFPPTSPPHSADALTGTPLGETQVLLCRAHWRRATVVVWPRRLCPAQTLKC